MCFLGGEHISLEICVSFVVEHVPRDMCFMCREHISRDMCFLGGETHIGRDKYFPWKKSPITRSVWQLFLGSVGQETLFIIF